MVLPLLLLLAVEGTFRLLGFGYPVAFFLRGQGPSHNTYIENDRFGWQFFGPELARQPWPSSLPAPKPPDTVRIFVFGESAAYGDPQPEFGLARFIESLFTQRFPASHFEVVNVAMTAINSHSILRIARDCAARQGDIWIIYMGNNEVVGPYGAGTVFGQRAAGLGLVRSSLALRSTRTGQALERALAGLHPRPTSQREWGGMQMFLSHQVRSTDPSMAVVYANFQRNLTDILELGRRAGAKIVLSTVASNLKDCSPFGSLHIANLAAADLARWEQHYQEGVRAQQTQLWAVALEHFAQAERIDGAFAELLFRSGQCSLALGKESEAMRFFTRARDEDTLRFRCDTRLNDIIVQAATGREKDGVLLADSRASVSPGQESFYDHVHLNFEGNYRLALSLAQQAAKLLPQNLSSEQPWPSLDDCARHLAWTDVDRFDADRQMLGRLNDPPFDTRLTHAAQAKHLNAELEKLLPATSPEGLRHSLAESRPSLALKPHDWVLHQHLARLLVRSHDLAAAADEFQQVVSLMPHYADAWLELGGILAEQKRDTEALSAFHQAQKLATDPTAASTGQALILARQGKTNEALAQFQRALKYKPYYTPAHLGAAKLLESIGRPLEARPHYEAALQDRMMTPTALAALGQMAFDKGWFAAAATNFADALRLNPADAANHFNLGLALSQLGQRVQAKEQFIEAIRLDPDLPEAHAHLGLELGRQGDDSGAVEQFAAAVRLKPELIEARLNLGIALSKQKRTSEALEQFQEVLRRNPKDPTALKYVRALSGK